MMRYFAQLAKETIKGLVINPLNVELSSKNKKGRGERDVSKPKPKNY